MNLLDLVNLVCTKVNQTEAEDVAACKLFAARRYEMIWNDQLWKDSLIEWTYTLPAAGSFYTADSPWLPTKQHLILPAAFDRVIAVRNNVRRFNVQSSELLYRVDYDAFQNGGMMLDYLVLPACVWEVDLVQNLIVLTLALSEDGKAASVDVLQADGSSTARDAVVMQAKSTLVDQVLRVDAFSKVKTGDAVKLSFGPYLSSQDATTRTVRTYTAAGVLLGTYTIANGQSVSVLSFAYATIDGGATQYPAPGGTSFGGIAIVTTGGVLTRFQTEAGFMPVTLQAADLAAPRRQRIQFMGTLETPALTVRVLGKAKCPALTADGDATILTGVDNCLLAATQYDMLQRERQYGKAQVAMQEYQGLLDQLKRAEVVQTAHNKRIVPDDGYGNPYDMWSHPPLTF